MKMYCRKPCDVVRNRAAYLGIEVVVGDAGTLLPDGEYFGLIPAISGRQW